MGVFRRGEGNRPLPAFFGARARKAADWKAGMRDRARLLQTIRDRK
jgi:hypothetical protein